MLPFEARASGDPITEAGEKYKPSQVPVTITTRYPNWRPGELTDVRDTEKVRGDLGRRLVWKAAGLGHPVVVVDNGSSEEFLGSLPSDITLVPFNVPNFGLQKREALIQASQLPDAKAIFRIEPEKVDMINHLQALATPVLNGQADVVVGNRREHAFRASYPDYAFDSEMLFNRTYERALRKTGLLAEDQHLDLYSGAIVIRNHPDALQPFLTRYSYTPSEQEGASKYNKVNLDGWSHAQVFGIVIALHQGLRVEGVPISFNYDPSQKANEEHPANKAIFMAKRDMQRVDGIRGGSLLLRHLLASPRDQLRAA